MLLSPSARNSSTVRQSLPDHSSSMDEFLENIISIPSWTDQEIAGTSLRSWDHSEGGQEQQQQQQRDEMLVVSFQNQLQGGSGASTSAHQAGSRNQQDQVSATLEHASQVSSWDHHFVPGSPLAFPKVSDGGASSDPNSVKKRYRDEELQQVYEGSGHSTIQQDPQRCQAPLAYDSNAPVAPAPAGIVARPRVRARRGQATDPHSIAERLRREKIAERMKSLQELVPNANKTDKASMLDEIIDYVKFLQLQVKVLSMSRLGGTGGTLAPLLPDLPIEVGEDILASPTPPPHHQLKALTSQDGNGLTEQQVARLMEEDMGSAMQYLQSKGLCLMPISLATSISSKANSTSGTSLVAASPTASISGALQQATLNDK